MTQQLLDPAVVERKHRWPRRLAADSRGASYVEYLILVALLGIGLIAAVRQLANATQYGAGGEAAAVAALREFDAGRSGPVGLARPGDGAPSAATLDPIVLVSAHGQPGGLPDPSDTGGLLPSIGAVVGGGIGFVVSGGLGLFAEVPTAGANTLLLPAEVTGGTVLGAGAGYASGVAIGRQVGDIGAALGSLGERAGAVVDWTEERAGSVVEWVGGLIAKDKDRTAKAKAQKALNTNREFKKWFHKNYKEKQKMPRGGLNNPNLDSDEVRDAYEDWLAQGQPKAD